MLTAQRYQIILQTLTHQGICKLNELVNLTDASESTIRRDLDELETQGLLERIHGGARLVTHLTSDQAQNDREQLNRSEKEQIARFAVNNFVRDQQVIYLDSGTSVQEVIPYLSRFKQLSIVTNSVTTALKLSEQNMAVFLPAGHLKNTTKALVGSATLAALTDYHFDLALIGTNGIAVTGALMTPDIDEANIKQTVIKNSTKSVVLSDPSKFKQVAFATFATLDDISQLVTTKLSKPLAAQFTQTNIKELS
ncbi:DeoR/GlpR family DNA-binding transcription regulator [Lapidilactobacillus mulanensis]|uniref:DeoR/GlpR family DNA-binding transcription regulator n=1 Tax=Lapidilactobacillus mulanensis TaxID=2485999 RepID=A0ABW4DR53_9LACO|nr:DeoR/GlpR family DNA-binding transcription regulator [Lapidilactobacillus mulanensis]